MTDKQTEKNKIDFAQFAPSRNFSIPNIISLLRLCLIPLFLFLYVGGYPWLAVGTVVFSALTDLVDGYIARHYNQITALGQVLDPIADKLTQIALAICLCFSFNAIIPLMIILLVKELMMLLLGLSMLRAGQPPVSACWWGKMSTAVFYAGILVIMAFAPQLGPGGVNIISLLISAVLLFSLIRYWLLFKPYIRKEG